MKQPIAEIGCSFTAAKSPHAHPPPPPPSPHCQITNSSFDVAAAATTLKKTHQAQAVSGPFDAGQSFPLYASQVVPSYRAVNPFCSAVTIYSHPGYFMYSGDVKEYEEENIFQLQKDCNGLTPQLHSDMSVNRLGPSAFTDAICFMKPADNCQTQFLNVGIVSNNSNAANVGIGSYSYTFSPIHEVNQKHCVMS